jgi:hypothetical protein
MDTVIVGLLISTNLLLNMLVYVGGKIQVKNIRGEIAIFGVKAKIFWSVEVPLVVFLKLFPYKRVLALQSWIALICLKPFKAWHVLFGYFS